jgi:hypothetical protein
MGALVAILPSIIQLIVTYGVPAAEQIYKMFSAPAGPTQADWDQLKTLTSTTARQQMLAVLAAHGIDPASPQGVALLALTA